MTKILEHASRVLAIMGIALIVWAGMGAQTAKAIDIAPLWTWATCTVATNAQGTNICDAKDLGLCDTGCCQTAAGPATAPGGGLFCCYKMPGGFPC